jgi:hypothetical protein
MSVSRIRVYAAIISWSCMHNNYCDFMISKFIVYSLRTLAIDQRYSHSVDLLKLLINVYKLERWSLPTVFIFSIHAGCRPVHASSRLTVAMKTVIMYVTMLCACANDRKRERALWGQVSRLQLRICGSSGQRKIEGLGTGL